MDKMAFTNKADCSIF